MPKSVADVRVEHHGNLYLFHARNALAQDWFEDYTDAQSWGTAYVVEHRYAAEITQALQDYGFIVE
jgi:hypothetical protein